MPRQFQAGELQPGSIYRDLDGQLVRLVKVSTNLCTWVPVCEKEKTRHATHRENFLRRFIPWESPGLKPAA